ncbi:hypothetical protein [Fredinandcohnia sp. 179-A 10B2 NHS]|uniref:hypothetical protein n=1 Tax=Fredinandcohnia sp. 179-A 10B2 NHS TaxID=3235176 RepID=UPI0039A0FA3A
MKKLLFTLLSILVILVSYSNKETVEKAPEPKEAEIAEPIVEDLPEDTSETSIKIFKSNEDGSFNVDESIDLDGDMIPETLLISGGSLGDDYIGEILLSVQKGEETYQVDLYNEGSTTFYVHDLNSDGKLEITFNGGYRIGVVKLYVLTDTGLQVTQDDISGWVEEITTNEIITDRGTYTFDGTTLLDQLGNTVASLIDTHLIAEYQEEYQEVEEEQVSNVEIEVVEEQPIVPAPTPKDEATLTYEAEINEILSELYTINSYFNEVIANGYPGEDYLELADVMTSIALKNHSLEMIKYEGKIPPSYYDAHDDMSRALGYYVKSAEILAALCYSNGSIGDYHIREFEEKYATRIDLAISYLGYAMDDYIENGFVVE